MSKDDRDRAQARLDKTTRAAQDARSGKADRDAASRAMLDNMAKLKALRLAREAAAPPAPVKAKKAAAKSKQPAEKRPTPALGDWLASQQSGGRRT
ncbi:hypothetical protein [Bradyrhizobium sp. JYMT SZCCT0180]|jgi:hypothetical protein|uniref:hypothetical protein n=1 Tax=Bradyrhizobium sp. JYMT SZCCT0180 TaxID=2807666 RepID=UPI00201162BB|nr:hypothetical protein [Bradyrhizobium sp. JYMT SZCCT0180]